MRIETCFAAPELDGRRGGLSKRLGRSLSRETAVHIVDAVLTDLALPPSLAVELFADPVVQFIPLTPAPELPVFKGWDWAIEIAWRPGVTDTLALTAREALEIAGIDTKGAVVQTARLYILKCGELGRQDIEEAFSGIWNPLVQSAVFIESAEWEKGKRFPELYPAVSVHDEPEPLFFDVAAMDEDALARLSAERLLALNLPELASIRDYYRSSDTISERRARGLPELASDVEIEMIAQTWSEHCKHKIFNAQIEYTENGKTETISSLFRTFIKAATETLAPSRPDLLSVFTDNAGVFKFTESAAICVKAETHNSPSALDPYGGAITGIVGVNRDIIGTGIGAMPLFNTDVLCFAPPDTPDSEVPAGLIPPRELLRGVHRGIVDGGDQSGIPVAAGAFVFDPSYLGKPLVFCGTGGIMPMEVRAAPSWEKSIEPGMLAVMVGGRIGKDGIHGATFSSLALDETSPASAVQIGDPIIQKRMTDFLLEARDRGLYRGITDNGAGGLSSSLGEMAESSGGVRIDLDSCPLKYPGLSPWEILISESQERMSLAVLPSLSRELLELSTRRGVEVSIVGEFTDSGFIEMTAGGRLVGLLSLDFLHRGLPAMKLRAEWKAPVPVDAVLPVRSDWNSALLEILADPDVASKESLVRQYDHEVKGISIEKPFTGVKRDAPSDGGVLKPLYESWRGLTVTHGIAPRLSDHDGAVMALAAVDEAYRAHIALGGDPEGAVALDNFCWPDPVESAANPDGAFKLAQLVRACRSLKEACIAYNLPLVSGKDSMKNDASVGGRRISVKPTLLVTLVGPIADVRKAMSSDFLAAGDLVYILGETTGLLGASIFERRLGSTGGDSIVGFGPAPVARPSYFLPLYRALSRAISGRSVRSCHDISDGGLAVALAESCLGGRLGAKIRLEAIPSSGDMLTGSGFDEGAVSRLAARLLFSEDPGRFLVSIRVEDRERFERSFSGMPFRLIGETVLEPRISATFGGKTVLDSALDEVEQAWKTPLL